MTFATTTLRTRVSLLAVLFIIQMGTLKAYGQQHRPHKQAVDSTLAVALQNKLDEGIQALGLMGASVAVLIPEQRAWLGANGMSDPVTGEVVHPDMIFAAGSITKNFVAALMLDLAEEGLLTLDDSLGQWLPAYPNIEGSITIRQLLNHTSGLFNYNEHPTFVDRLLADLAYPWTPEEIITTFLEAPYFSPGSNMYYSNTNYILAGMIIEQATGATVSSELRSRFLTPLGLQHTFFPDEEQIIGDEAHGWEDMDGDGLLDDLFSFPQTALRSLEWTAGAIYATASDIAHWGQALFSGQLITEASLYEMLDFLPGVGYGLGTFEVELQGHVLWGHDGGTEGYTSLLLCEPQEEICIAVMLNIGEESLPVPGSNYLILAALMDVTLDHIATDVETPVSEVPTAFDLRQNYPNPFNPATTIEYYLPNPAQVTLTIYNTVGQKVRTLVNTVQPSGLHSVVWDGTNAYGKRAASGLYLYQITMGQQVQTRTMMMVQ